MNNQLSRRLLFLLAILTFASCKDDDIKEILIGQLDSKPSVLKFKDPETLQAALEEFHKAQNKEEVFDEIIHAYSENKSLTGFTSLQLLKKELDSDNSDKKANGSLRLSSYNTLNSDSLDALVPDPAFASVLNENLEIQVGRNLYKVTPYGTFYTNIENQEKLVRIIEKGYSTDNEELISENLYKIESNEEIYRYDTYVAISRIPHEIIPEDDYSPAGSSSGSNSTSYTCNDYYQPMSYTNYPYNLPKDEYCKFKTYSYGSKTIVGGWLESLFGTNSAIKENFDSKNRIKVKLYNFNYVVYSSIGLKVKFQRKGWTGIWDKKDCDQLVIGWDAITFETPNVFTKPTGMPEFPAKAISKEILKFANFDIPVKSVTDFDIVFNNKSIYDYSDLQKDLNKQSEIQLASLLKKVWTSAEKELAYKSWEAKEDMVKAFRQVYPSKFVTVLSRHEVTKRNDGEINLIFDWNTCRITYKTSDPSTFNVGSNILKPTYNNKAFSYKVIKASIYGAGKHGNKWKGVRIKKD